MPTPRVHPDDQHDPVLQACRQLARAMDLFDERACLALGLGRSDLRALNELEHGPLGHAVLADRLGLSRASVTALVDRLEDSGYVTRTPNPADRRGVLIELRPATWQAFARVYSPLGRRVRATTAGLPARDRRIVTSALEAVARAFDDDDAPVRP